MMLKGRHATREGPVRYRVTKDLDALIAPSYAE